MRGLPGSSNIWIPQHGTQTSTSSGAFTVPNGVFSLTEKLIGASGGSGDNSITRGSSGSGGGAECQHKVAVTPGQIITFVVGLHGTGAVAGSNLIGTSGGDTTIVAQGLTAGGSVGGKRNSAGGAGGTASGGNIANTSGSAGGSSTGSASGGNGGNAAAPDGGAGGTAPSGQGTAPGGGSAGPNSGVSQSGTDGVDGAVIFVW